MSAVSQQLSGAKISNGPRPWQVIQRGSNGLAEISVEGTWYFDWPGMDSPGAVQVRIAREYDGSSVPGCDWRDAEMLPDNQWRATFQAPTGGLYRIESRLGWLTGEKIWHIAVGDIWVITGQSNAVGYGRGTVVDPPALGVSLFGMDEEWRMATHPIFDPTGTKHPANYDVGWVDASPWLTFGKVILENAGVPVGLVPAALGGSPMCAWDPGSDNPFLFDNMNAFIEAAGGRVAGTVWYQGCSDTNSEQDCTTYLARFTRFVEGFRARYGESLPVITAQLNRHIDASPTLARYWSIVREAQRQAARTIPNLGVVTTLDLPLSDAIHTSAAGNVVLGERFGRAALGMLYGQDLSWRPADVSGIEFIGEERKSVRVSYCDVSGWFCQLCMDLASTFTVEDEDGVVPIASGRIETQRSLILDLERAPSGRTVCHSAYGGNPTHNLRDLNLLPTLAFYGVEVRG